MVKINESIIKTESHFSKDSKYRYLLRKEWDKRKKKAMVIMINPSSADSMIIDHTTMYVINNLSKLEFGSVDIINIFSKICSKISLKEDLNELIGEENNDFIKNSALESDSIIIAWGSIGNSSKKIKERQNEVLELLYDYKDKMYIICDPNGKRGLHPLCPSIRNTWRLEPYQMEVKTQAKQEQKQEKNHNQTKSKAQDKGQKKRQKEVKADD